MKHKKAMLIFDIKLKLKLKLKGNIFIFISKQDFKSQKQLKGNLTEHGYPLSSQILISILIQPEIIYLTNI